MKKASPMSMIGFPLLLIPIAICNIIAFLMPGVLFTTPLVTLTLMSGVAWPVTLGDVLIALGMILLLFEVIKGARPGAKYFTDHLLSLIVFGGAAAEFVMLPQFGSSTYFLLALLALIDFLSGIALRARRSVRTVAVPAPSVSRNEPAVPEPRFDPAPAPVSSPAPAVPTAAPVAESILKSAPEPVVIPSETIANEAAPAIQPQLPPDQPSR
jgi:hypothetical protein